MTFRELFKVNNGYDIILSNKGEGVYPCPSKYGYEKKNPNVCRRMIDCKTCWDRQIPKPSDEESVIEVGDKSALHEKLCAELTDTYRKKNHDYGDSFHKSYVEDGLLMAKIRIGDKYNRFKSLVKSDQQVKDESIRDTLMDMANYCIMTVMELEGNTK